MSHDGNRHHWMQDYAHPQVLEEFGLDRDVLSSAAIANMRTNPNCKALAWNERPTRLLLTEKQQEAIQNNLHLVIDIPFVPRDPRLLRLTLTACEIRSVNEMVSAIDVKQVNRSQIRRKTFLLSAFRNEINNFCYALEMHQLIEGPFKLYQTLDNQEPPERPEYWDTRTVYFPLSEAIAAARRDYSTGASVPSRCHSMHPWQDAGNDMLAFRESACALLQMLWLGVHPWR